MDYDYDYTYDDDDDMELYEVEQLREDARLEREDARIEQEEAMYDERTFGEYEDELMDIDL